MGDSTYSDYVGCFLSFYLIGGLVDSCGDSTYSDYAGCFLSFYLIGGLVDSRGGFDL